MNVTNIKPTCLTLFSELNLFIKLWVSEFLCIAYRVELPDGNYELVPEAEGELAEGEVNVVKVQKDPDQDPEEFSTDGASEGKSRSITQVFFYLCNYVDYVCAFTFQELNWNPRCMILGSYVQILAW